eukprot:jgi/Chrzof1/3630/Cz13g03030.t1
MGRDGRLLSSHHCLVALGPYTSTPPVSQALPPHAHSSQQNQAGAGTASDDDDDMPMAIRAKQLEDIPLATRAKQLGINLAHGSVMHVGVSNDHVEQTVNRPGRRSSSGEALDWFDASDSRWEGAMQRIKRRWADFTPDHEARMQQARISVRDVVATPVTGGARKPSKTCDCYYKVDGQVFRSIMKLQEHFVGSSCSNTPPGPAGGSYNQPTPANDRTSQPGQPATDGVYINRLTGDASRPTISGVLAMFELDAQEDGALDGNLDAAHLSNGHAQPEFNFISEMNDAFAPWAWGYEAERELQQEQMKNHGDVDDDNQYYDDNQNDDGSPNDDRVTPGGVAADGDGDEKPNHHEQQQLLQLNRDHSIDDRNMFGVHHTWFGAQNDQFEHKPYAQDTAYGHGNSDALSSDDIDNALAQRQEMQGHGNQDWRQLPSVPQGNDDLETPLPSLQQSDSNPSVSSSFGQLPLPHEDTSMPMASDEEDVGCSEPPAKHAGYQQHAYNEQQQQEQEQATQVTLASSSVYVKPELNGTAPCAGGSAADMQMLTNTDAEPCTTHHQSCQEQQQQQPNHTGNATSSQGLTASGSGLHGSGSTSKRPRVASDGDLAQANGSAFKTLRMDSDAHLASQHMLPVTDWRSLCQLPASSSVAATAAGRTDALQSSIDASDGQERKDRSGFAKHADLNQAATAGRPNGLASNMASEAGIGSDKCSTVAADRQTATASHKSSALPAGSEQRKQQHATAAGEAELVTRQHRTDRAHRASGHNRVGHVDRQINKAGGRTDDKDQHRGDDRHAHRIGEKSRDRDRHVSKDPSDSRGDKARHSDGQNRHGDERRYRHHCGEDVAGHGRANTDVDDDGDERGAQHRRRSRERLRDDTHCNDWQGSNKRLRNDPYCNGKASSRGARHHDGDLQATSSVREAQQHHTHYSGSPSRKEHLLHHRRDDQARSSSKHHKRRSDDDHAGGLPSGRQHQRREDRRRAGRSSSRDRCYTSGKQDDRREHEKHHNEKHWHEQQHAKQQHEKQQHAKQQHEKQQHDKQQHDKQQHEKQQHEKQQHEKQQHKKQQHENYVPKQYQDKQQSDESLAKQHDEKHDKLPATWHDDKHDEVLAKQPDRLLHSSSGQPHNEVIAKYEAQLEEARREVEEWRDKAEALEHVNASLQARIDQVQHLEGLHQLLMVTQQCAR